MSATLLTGALLLDAALGEPSWLWSRLPHPAVLFGRAVGWCDARFNVGTQRRLKGALCIGGLVVAACGLGFVVSLMGPVITCLVAAILIAQRSLVDHVRAVADALRLSVGDGRRMVARIVSRDTTDMDGADVARAAIESAAENLSDGVIAPAFWFLVAGAPGIVIYKLVNTADSMIGYRTQHYAEFGWAAARLDDVLNWIPARVTAGLIALSAGLKRGWGDIRADAALHKSPNAGWPEAAMARVLDVALAGPRSYDGTRRDLPFVHEDGAHQIGPDEIDAAVGILWRGWALLLTGCLLIALF